MAQFSAWDGSQYRTMGSISAWDGSAWRNMATAYAWDGSAWQLVFAAAAANPSGIDVVDISYCGGNTGATQIYKVTGTFNEPPANNTADLEFYSNNVLVLSDTDVTSPYSPIITGNQSGNTIKFRVRFKNIYSGLYSDWLEDTVVLTVDVCYVPAPAGLSITDSLSCLNSVSTSTPTVNFTAPGSLFQTYVHVYRRNPDDTNEVEPSFSGWIAGTYNSWGADPMQGFVGYKIFASVTHRRISTSVEGGTVYTSVYTLGTGCTAPPATPTVSQYSDTSFCTAGTSTNRFQFTWTTNDSADLVYYILYNGTAQAEINLGTGTSVSRTHNLGDGLTGSTSRLYVRSKNAQGTYSGVASLPGGYPNNTITYTDMCAAPPDVTGLTIQDTSFAGGSSRATAGWTNTSNYQVNIQWYLNGFLRSSNNLAAGATSNNLYEDLVWSTQPCYFRVKFYNGTLYSTNWATSSTITFV